MAEIKPKNESRARNFAEDGEPVPLWPKRFSCGSTLFHAGIKLFRSRREVFSPRRKLFSLRRKLF